MPLVTKNLVEVFVLAQAEPLANRMLEAFNVKGPCKKSTPVVPVTSTLVPRLTPAVLLIFIFPKLVVFTAVPPMVCVLVPVRFNTPAVVPLIVPALVTFPFVVTVVDLMYMLLVLETYKPPWLFAFFTNNNTSSKLQETLQMSCGAFILQNIIG